jgi:hypothetical protein
LEGGDATGLLAVGAYFSGRYPSIWAVRGTVWDSVPAKVARYLEQRGITAVSIELERIVIEAARTGVSRAELGIAAGDTASAQRVVRALRVDTAATDSAGGAEADSARVRSRLQRADLQFTDLHRIDVRVYSSSDTTVVRLLPARPWETREANTFNPPATPDFSLADAYSVGGLYGPGSRAGSYRCIHQHEWSDWWCVSH